MSHAAVCQLPERRHSGKQLVLHRMGATLATL